MLVSQAALSLQFQLVLEETVKLRAPPLAGMLREAGLMARLPPAPAWVTVWVRVRLPAVMVMVALRAWVEGLAATEYKKVWLPGWLVGSLLVSHGALELQVQVVLVETVKAPLLPVAGMLRVVGLTVRLLPPPVWVTVWVRVMFPAVMVMVAVRIWVEVLGATE